MNPSLRITLDVSPFELLILQDATDDCAGAMPSPAKRSRAARVTMLQRKLHALTGEEMPPTQAARRASLRRLLKNGNANSKHAWNLRARDVAKIKRPVP